MTLVWHVDNILASLVDEFGITLLLTRLAKVFKCDPTVKRADVLDVLGIDMDFLQKEKVLVSQIKYLAGVIHEFPKRITGIAPTPAADHLFDIRDNDDSKKRMLFNSPMPADRSGAALTATEAAV